MSLLEVDNASKRFGSLRAVDGVSMSVESGELRAIIGPNGAGKTTFFNLLSGLFRPTAGRVIFAGEDITRLRPEQRVSRGIARTFQITEIFPELTASENLRIPVEIVAGYRMRPWISRRKSEALNKRVTQLLAMGGLNDKANRLAGELSHGDQRTIEILMALSLRPRLLLLDEPTAGMGEQETDEVVRLISGLHQQLGLTILLIEHDMHVVFQLASRILVLAEGRVLAEGTPEQISANDAVQTAYLGMAA
ncbi:MAG TPA: ABC transporter ATP-binding protein [Bradyrhizobium sp.]|nr:ABC transporter ATP-binding protein [Bradyrhizobium sp.]